VKVAVKVNKTPLLIWIDNQNHAKALLVKIIA
jgi:hypothetical protein